MGIEKLKNHKEAICKNKDEKWVQLLKRTTGELEKVDI